MSRTFRAIPMVRLVVFTVLVLLVALLLQSVSADAAPPTAPLLGVTSTPTETPTMPTDTPTVTPETPTETPTVTPETPTETPTATAVSVPVGTPTPGPAPDLVIEKRAAPVETYPGGEVTFIIAVTNAGQLAAVDVVVTDAIDERLTILGASASQGTVSISGQTVRADVGVIGPGHTVEITIRVRVREDVPVPSDIENVAVVRSPNSDDRSSSVIVRVSTVLTLPEAGKVAWGWWGLLLMAAGGLIVLLALLRSRDPIQR